MGMPERNLETLELKVEVLKYSGQQIIKMKQFKVPDLLVISFQLSRFSYRFYSELINF